LDQNRVRSLQFEHVSPASLMLQEISRPSKNPAKAGDKEMAAMRRWFWTRKPDAGFLLKGFPATLLQALVLDEWLDARSEGLDAVLAARDADDALVQYYRDQGLLCETTPDFAP
jgi:adenylate kinase